MMPFALKHILESTVFCALLFVVARWFTRGAAARHAIGLVGVVKFVLPSLLLAPTGARLAFFWPAAPWLSSLINRVSAVLAEATGLMPANMSTQATCTLIVVWSAGSAAMVALWCVRLRRGKRQTAAATLAEQSALERALRSLPVRLPVRMATAQVCEGPALHGIWRATVIVPQLLAGKLDPDELHAVLLHELAHARRLDNLVGAFVHAVVCLFWFNPIVWWLESWLRAQCEQACDELVLQIGVRPRVYASGILKVCRFHVLGTAPGVSAIAGSDLQTRLNAILDGRIQTPRCCAPRVVVAALGLLMTLIPVAGGYCSQCVSNQPAREAAPASR